MKLRLRTSQGRRTVRSSDRRASIPTFVSAASPDEATERRCTTRGHAIIPPLFESVAEPFVQGGQLGDSLFELAEMHFSKFEGLRAGLPPNRRVECDRIETVARVVLAVVLGLLTLSASGAVSLIAGEPCTSYEEAGQTDTSCPPTCVTCGCCAQAAEDVVVVRASSSNPPAAVLAADLPHFPVSEPRPIFHVPKLPLA